MQLCFVTGDRGGRDGLVDRSPAYPGPGAAGGTVGESRRAQGPALGSEDLEVFQRWLGVLPQPLFDTQRAAALLDLGFGLGYRDSGAGNLCC